MPTKEELLAYIKKPGFGGVFEGPSLQNSSLKDAALRALQLAPQGIGAGGPLPVGGPITGGKSFQMLNEMSPTIVHNPGSAVDIGLKAPLKTDLGSPQVSGAGIAENANRFNPKVNDILDHLAKRDIPVKQIVDSKGGTTYIKATNPIDNKNMQIRVPDPENPHFGRNDIIKPFVNKNGRASLFDLGTPTLEGKQKSGGGVLRRETSQNESGQRYGEGKEGLQALYDAIDVHTARALSPPGTKPNYNEQSRALPAPEPPVKPDPNQLNFNDLIDKHVADLYGGYKSVPEGISNKVMSRASMENPQLTTSEMKSMSFPIKDILRKYEFLRE